MKSNVQQRHPIFDRFNSFGHDELTAQHCYFGCSSLLHDADGIKIFDGDDLTTNTKIEQCFVAWSSSSKIMIPSALGGLEYPNKDVLQ